MMPVLSVFDRIREFLFGATNDNGDDADDMPQSAPVTTGILGQFMVWMGWQNRPAMVDGPETPRMMVLMPLATSTPGEGARRADFILVEELSPIIGQVENWFDEGAPPMLWNAPANLDPAPSEHITPVRRRHRRPYGRNPTPFPAKDQKRARNDSM
uniref:DUF768 domain-containing protein n=1 Tax=Panagrellus redivivus TaxID=6233 RepID=A0A7E5A052_PANRE